MTKIPVIGPPPHWKWFPERSSHYVMATDWTIRVRSLWHVNFGDRRRPPTVWWSDALGRKSDVHARTYHWGIVLSRKHAKRHDWYWINDLLLHELLHWAGYGHDRRFREAAKRLGTW